MVKFLLIRFVPTVFILTLICAVSTGLAQSIQGTVTSQGGEPIVYASIYVKELKMGTSANSNGSYFINLPAGKYTVVYRSLGFETVEKQVDVSNDNVTLNVTLDIRPYQIAPVTIGSKAEDPAYAIIRKAIGYAPYYQNQVKEFDAEVYLKGTLKVKKLSWLVKKAIKNDPDAPKEGDFYLQESVNNIHFTAPNKYDQRVTHFRSNFPGNSDASESVMEFTNASFYQPQVGDIVLPLAPNALRFYSYKYDGFTIQDNRVIYKIKVIPKRKSKQLVSGFLYIADEYYNLHGVDLNLETYFGTVKMKQSFGEVERDVWLPISHFFVVNGAILGNEGDVNYVSSVKYSHVKVNGAIRTPSELALAFKRRPVAVEAKPQHPKEGISPRKQQKQKRDSLKMDALLQKENLTNREMYQLSKLMDKKLTERDTSTHSLEVVSPVNVTVDSSAQTSTPEQWQQLRPVLLTKDETVVDSSIRYSLRSESDSAQVDTTRSSNIIGTVLLGNRWQNKQKSRTFIFSGVLNPSHFQFNTVDGFVLGASFEFHQRFTSTALSINPTLSYSFSRKVPMGSISSHLNYANRRRGTLSFTVSSTSADFNKQHGISKLVNTPASLLFGRNYMKLYQENTARISNSIDLTNGLELFTQFEYAHREMLPNTTSYILVEQNRARYTSNIPQNKRVNTSNFETSSAFISEFHLSYTPFYYYEVYKGRKQMLYSKYPTVKVLTRFATPNVFGSSARFGMLEGSINHSINTGPGSKFTYGLSYGGFFSSRNMFFSDFVHFSSHRSPVIARSFVNSFQNADYYQFSTNSTYGVGFATYQTPYLALKFLPFISNTMWQENIHLSLLKLKGEVPYYELGYSVSRIAAIANVGVFAGFEGHSFSSLSVKLSFSLFDE